MASSTVRSKSRVTTHPERNGECVYGPRWRAVRGRYASQSTHVHSVVGDAKDCMPAGLQAALLFFQRRIPPRLLQRKRPQSASLLSALRTSHPFRDVFQTSIPAAKPSQCVRLRLSLVTTFRTFEHESVGFITSIPSRCPARDRVFADHSGRRARATTHRADRF